MVLSESVAWFVIAIAFGACSRTHDRAAPGPGPNLPAPLRAIATPNDVAPFTRFALPGVTLWIATPHTVAPDSDDGPFVVGVDASQHVLRGVELLRLSTNLPAATLAERLQTINGGPPPADPTNARPTTVAADEWGFVSPPAIADGVLTYWIVRGGLSVGVTRVRVELRGSAPAEYTPGSRIGP